MQNSQPLWHYVLADNYARRNKQVPSIDPRRQVRVPRMPEVYSAKPPQRRFHGFDPAGHYTSACGISIYRDDLLFPREQMHAFTCEPFHNLVQHHVLQHDGTSFQGDRADDGPIDFFASSDRWTRPVMTRTGPDGALWIVDIYRYMIEHPEWLPQEGKDALLAGYRAGDQMGRVYRVVPSDRALRALRTIPKIDGMANAEVIQLLENPNGIVRDTVHRELTWRELTAAETDRIRDIATHARLPESRVQSLALLQTLDAISVETILAAANDEDAAVRRQAIRLAESFLASNVLTRRKTPGSTESFQVNELSLDSQLTTVQEVLSLANDPDAKVRLQLAASLGEWSGEHAGKTLARLAARTDNDGYTTAAIISSMPLHFETVSQLLLTTDTVVSDPILDALLLMGEAHPTQLAQILSSLMSSKADDGKRFRVIARWLDTLSDRSRTFTSIARQHEELAAVADEFQTLLSEAREISGATDRDAKQRAAAIGMLGREASQTKGDISALDELLSTNQPEAVQIAAMDRLTRLSSTDAADMLIANWSQFLPTQQQRASTALLARTDWTLRLLDAIQDGTIPALDLSLSQQQALRGSNQKTIAARAADVLGVAADRERSAIVGDYSAKLTSGNASQGQLVFETNCKVCHTLDKSQKPVGPDLRSLTNRSRDALLNSILDPSQAVEPKFLNYTIVLNNGENLTGLIADEGEGSLTLVDANGKPRTVLRDSIDLAQRSATSMMPEGFETKISPAAMSDLLAFLREL